MPCILVASDMSARSDRAVLRALRLGHRLGHPVRVLSVVDEDAPESLREPTRTRARDLLNRFVAAQPRGADAEVEIRLGDPATAIPAAAEDADAALVVLGLHRPRAILDHLRETTMERMVRATARPVLLVRDPADHDYESVLVPVAFSPACAQAVRAAHATAPGADMTLFHAWHVPFTGFTGEAAGGPMTLAVRAEQEALCAEWLARHPLPEGVSPPELLQGGVMPTLEAHLRTQRPHLLAMGAHTRSGLALYTLGEIAAELIRRPPCDLLLARPAAAAGRVKAGRAAATAHA